MYKGRGNLTLNNNMYNSQYYQDKRKQLQNKNQQIVQRLVSGAFDFVSEITDLQERLKELDSAEQLNNVNNESVKEGSNLDVKTDKKIEDNKEIL